jgi:hypothetical protein
MIDLLTFSSFSLRFQSSLLSQWFYPCFLRTVPTDHSIIFVGLIIYLLQFCYWIFPSITAILAWNPSKNAQLPDFAWWYRTSQKTILGFFSDSLQQFSFRTKLNEIYCCLDHGQKDKIFFDKRIERIVCGHILSKCFWHVCFTQDLYVAVCTYSATWLKFPLKEV